MSTFIVYVTMGNPVYKPTDLYVDTLSAAAIGDGARTPLHRPLRLRDAHPCHNRKQRLRVFVHRGPRRCRDGSWSKITPSHCSNRQAFPHWESGCTADIQGNAGPTPRRSTSCRCVTEGPADTLRLFCLIPMSIHTTRVLTGLRGRRAGLLSLINLPACPFFFRHDVRCALLCCFSIRKMDRVHSCLFVIVLCTSPYNLVIPDSVRSSNQSGVNNLSDAGSQSERTHGLTQRRRSTRTTSSYQKTRSIERHDREERREQGRRYPAE